MISKITQALLLSGCLVAAGTAGASERDVIVPVIAGAAVGAILATVIGSSSAGHHDRAHYQSYQPPPRYVARYQPVAYVPVAPRVEYRRFEPARPHDYHRGFDHARGDGRW